MKKVAIILGGKLVTLIPNTWPLPVENYSYAPVLAYTKVQRTIACCVLVLEPPLATLHFHL